MSQEQEAQEAMTCARCGRFSGPEVLCARCDEGPQEQEEERASRRRMAMSEHVMDLDQEIAEAYGAACAQEHAERQAAAERARQRERSVTAAFRLLVVDELGERLVEALRAEVRYHNQRERGGEGAEATIVDGERVYELSARRDGGWHVCRQRGPYTHPTLDAARGQLRALLLSFLGAERAQEARKAQQQAQQQARDEARARRAEEKRAMDQARREEAERENERRKAQAEQETVAALEEARASLFQWPAGRTITLFFWKWCTAPATDEASAEYDEGWSAQDRPDGDGYVTLYGYSGGARRLRLLAEHLPLVEARTFEGTAALPGALRRTPHITVPLSQPYTTDDPYGPWEREVTERNVEVGAEPEAWVQRLIAREA